MPQLDVEIKQVFTVRYKDQIRKETAIAVLNAIQGVVAENDNRGGSLLRDITVIVKKKIDLENSERILKQVASFVCKKSEFIGGFKDDKKGNAIIEVKKLKGVANAQWKLVRRNNNATINPNAPSTLIVHGNADPKMVLATLNKYGTAYISR